MKRFTRGGTRRLLLASLLLNVLSPNGATNWPDSVPFKFKTSNSSNALVCMLPKAGSTQWKRLLWKHATQLDPPLTRVDENFVHEVNLPAAAQEFDVDERTVRFALVRHPITRLVSAFRDKILVLGSCRGVSRWSVWDHWRALPREWECDRKPSLAEFVDWFVTQESRSVNIHFRPQSFMCRFRKGVFQASDIYKTEELPAWYHDVVDKLQLRGDVTSGFQEHADGGTCFYTCPGLTCRDMGTMLGRQRCMERASETGGSFTNKRGEQSGTSGLVKSLTDDLRVKLVQFYAADFALFNYSTTI